MVKNVQKKKMSFAILLMTYSDIMLGEHHEDRK